MSVPSNFTNWVSHSKWVIYRETGEQWVRRDSHATRAQAVADAQHDADHWRGAPSRFHVVKETTSREFTGNIFAGGRG